MVDLIQQSLVILLLTRFKLAKTLRRKLVMLKKQSIRKKLKRQNQHNLEIKLLKLICQQKMQTKKSLNLKNSALLSFYQDWTKSKRNKKRWIWMKFSFTT